MRMQEFDAYHFSANLGETVGLSTCFLSTLAIKCIRSTNICWVAVLLAMGSVYYVTVCTFVGMTYVWEKITIAVTVLYCTTAKYLGLLFADLFYIRKD